MIYTKKIIISLLIFSFLIMKSQSNNYITSNIQQNLINKYWSSTLNDSKKIVFHFTNNQIHVYSNGKRVASDLYYMTNISCNSPSIQFDNSKVGTLSEGNFIKNQRSCFVVELYDGLQKFRLKRSYETDDKWQTYYLLDNPDLEY